MNRGVCPVCDDITDFRTARFTAANNIFSVKVGAECADCGWQMVA